jgi:hypothetical protein
MTLPIFTHLNFLYAQRFVMLVTALEAVLLSEKDREGKLRKLSKQTVGLLGKKFVDIRSLYDLRSRIVHGSFPREIEIDAAIPRVEYILYHIIRRLLSGFGSDCLLVACLGYCVNLY